LFGKFSGGWETDYYVASYPGRNEFCDEAADFGWSEKQRWRQSRWWRVRFSFDSDADYFFVVYVVVNFFGQ
jgi:hypothetical protein